MAPIICNVGLLLVTKVYSRDQLNLSSFFQNVKAVLKPKVDMNALNGLGVVYRL